MCSFFSCGSDGKGKVIHFTPADIVEIMANGNPNSYDFNSHTSMFHFHKIEGEKEDKWNKWEYDPETNELKEDTLSTLDDRVEVLKYLEKYFKDKNIIFLRNLYGSNSGHCNSGNRNSGDYNSGDYNSGHYNSGHCNSGNRNSGDYNSGDYNSGDYNSGHYNSGHCNSGNRNSGPYNSGHYNSGNRNSGDYNSGDYNSGDYNSGLFNTTTPKLRFFNKDTDLSPGQFNAPSCLNRFTLQAWVRFDAMTDKEKIDYPKAYVCDGYLKSFSYKDAWKNLWDSLSENEKMEIKNIPNFDVDIFFEITGIDVRK